MESHRVRVPYLLTHSSADGRLGWFHVLAVVNSVTVKMMPKDYGTFMFQPKLVCGIGILI